MTVGCVAGDEESYEVFKDLFDPIISDRHGGYKPSDKHKTDLNFENLKVSNISTTTTTTRNHSTYLDHSETHDTGHATPCTSGRFHWIINSSLQLLLCHHDLIDMARPWFLRVVTIWTPTTCCPAVCVPAAASRATPCPPTTAAASAEPLRSCPSRVSRLQAINSC